MQPLRVLHAGWQQRRPERSGRSTPIGARQLDAVGSSSSNGTVGVLGSPRMSQTQRLVVVLVLNFALVAGLVAVGVTAHSLAVVAEGSDYLLDAAGVGVALLAIRLSARPASRAQPEGYPNASSLAALINGGWLLILELLVAGAAVDRLVTRTPQVDGL